MSTSAQPARTATQNQPVSGPVWTLRAGAASLRVTSGTMTSRAAATASHFQVIPFLRGWIADPLTRDFMRAMYRAAYGRVWAAANAGEGSELLYEALDAAFRSGVLIVAGESSVVSPARSAGDAAQDVLAPEKTWRIPARGREVQLGLRSQAAPGQRVLTPAVLIGHLDEWLGNTRTHRAVTELYGEAFNVHPALRPKLTDPDQRAAARERLADAIRGGLIVGLVERTFGSAESEAAAAPPAPAPASERPPVEEKTWFECQLVDEDGEPMANEKYTLVDSDGGRHQGKLDAQGKVYIPPTLNPGMCTITFPEIHLNPRKKKK